MSQYVQVNPMLRAKILSRLTPEQLNPENYSFESEWDSVSIEGENGFDIEFWFDENRFKVTAYFVTTNADGDPITDMERFFPVFQMTCKGIEDEL